MESTLMKAIEKRRSYYSITNHSPVSDSDIEEIVHIAATHIPSAFNSQSTRLVLLLGRNHLKLWDIVTETLRERVSPESFSKTQSKIASFAAGYATILFFEDQSVVESMQKSFPAYASNFPLWSQQTSAMHQFAIWTLLEDVGFGASLQHYNPIIDAQVQAEWNLPPFWKLIAQMPFGTPAEAPGEKTYQPLSLKVKVFK